MSSIIYHIPVRDIASTNNQITRTEKRTKYTVSGVLQCGTCYCRLVKYTVSGVLQCCTCYCILVNSETCQSIILRKLIYSKCVFGVFGFNNN